jgi:RNA polymerase sigma-70 factor, ECF subfamily
LIFFINLVLKPPRAPQERFVSLFGSVERITPDFFVRNRYFSRIYIAQRMAYDSFSKKEIYLVTNRYVKGYMSKRRSQMTNFALPVPGIRARGMHEERIRIVNARGNASSHYISERATEAPHARGLELVQANGVSANGAAEDVTADGTRISKSELTALEDGSLIRLFQSGEEAAFYVLFERRQKEIYTHCYRMCGRDTEKANDAFQDTFVKVFSRKDLFTDTANGRAWLYRIATNTCLNQLRYDRRHPSEALDEDLNSIDPRMQPDFGTEQDSLRASLEQAMAKLPMELREPFLLRELEEFSYEDAAAQLGITIAACRQRVYRAKQLLREALEEVVTGEAPKKKRKWGRA